MEDMNRQCEFHEFIAILQQHMIEEASTPEAKQEHRNNLIDALLSKMRRVEKEKFEEESL